MTTRRIGLPSTLCHCLLLRLHVGVRTTQDFLNHHPLVKSKLIQPFKRWPANSPDLNSIENLMVPMLQCGFLCFELCLNFVFVCSQGRTKKRVQRRMQKLPKRVPRTMEKYFEILEQEWARTPAKTLQHLVDSMHSRCAECVERKGDVTDY